MTPHPCPHCVCSPSPRTCWTCASAGAVTAPCCYVLGADEQTEAVYWFDANVSDVDGRARFDAPPCPGWREREGT